jgi:hypothetical protein
MPMALVSQFLQNSSRALFTFEMARLSSLTKGDAHLKRQDKAN